MSLNDTTSSQSLSDETISDIKESRDSPKSQGSKDSKKAKNKKRAESPNENKGNDQSSTLHGPIDPNH